MPLVDNDIFIQELSKLFETTNQKGTSIWLTHKRLNYDSKNATMLSPNGEMDGQEYPCLVRVTDGSQTKFSTCVEPGQLEKFHTIYGGLLKASMTTLRKRDKKREKERAERTAIRKQRINQPVVVEGPKRGKGRRKRQRRIKAAIKQEAARKSFEDREKAKLRTSP